MSGEIFGYYPITRQYFERYRLPVMHTETNSLGGKEAVSWLRKEWANVHRLKQEGVPLLGFTWYSLTDQMDWDTALREDRHVAPGVARVLVDLHANRHVDAETVEVADRARELGGRCDRVECNALPQRQFARVCAPN